MKKRLNIFCLLVLLALGVSVYMSFTRSMAGFVLGVEASHSSIHDPVKMQYFQNMTDVSLRPVSEHFFQDSVYNEITSSYLPAAHFRMIVGLPPGEATSNVWRPIMILLFFLAFLAVMIMAIVLFIRLIIAINKSDIFSWKNVYRLYKLGGCLIFLFGLEFLSVILTGCQAENVLSIPGYEVNVMDTLSFTSLILGVSALLVGEVFAIGLRLKEEQELTI